MKLRILVAASEVVGFAKTGGLADVAGSLPLALAERGHEVAIVMPYYRCVRLGKHFVERTEHVVPVPIGSRNLACRLFHTTIPNSNVKVFLIDQPEYFDRDDPAQGKGLYQQNMPGGYKADYPDNAERFAFFSRAVLETMHEMDFVPDIIHANDWQTGLVPVFLQEIFRQRPEYGHTRCIYTIHNIAYQGMFGSDVMKLTNLPGYLFNHNQLEFHGQFNFLKAGVVYADVVNTVSEKYSHEIQTAEYGCGMEGLLRGYRAKLTGIMNGVDYGVWNPAKDPHIPAPYDTTNVFTVKPKIKAELQRRYGLPVDPDKPLLGLVARLVSQKGIDLVLSAAPGFLDLGCQMVFLGEGDPEFHNELQQFRDKHPNQVGIYLGYHEQLAHLIEGGSDLFLMPSRYEPSGLNQLYSMKYGTPPIVRATGGLSDSVTGATEETLKTGKATGFSFGDYTPDALYQTVKWAVTLYRDRPKDFQKVVLSAMKEDWSWNRSAEKYEAMYRKALGR